MAIREKDNARTSHYAVLGVSRGASAEDIKHAYREKAKAAHPDAGGSVSAMARVNEAYMALSDPETRRAYDGEQSAEASRYATRSAARPASSGTAQPSGETYVNHPRGAQPFAQTEPEHITRSRAAWARASAWEMLRFSLPATILAVLSKYYLADSITGVGPVVAFGFITFLPVYFLSLSVLFLADPPMRLIFADLVRRYPTTQHQRRNALALVLAFFPLALIWAFWP